MYIDNFEVGLVNLMIGTPIHSDGGMEIYPNFVDEGLLAAS
jgi:hypothetical protein